MTRATFTKQFPLVVFLLCCIGELSLVAILTDLPISVGNWQGKSRELLDMSFPTSNFYGPGGAILILPFLWSGPSFFIPVLFYFTIGCIGFFLLSREIENKSIRFISLALIPANPYLIWLCYSSQDTVFEFALLMWSMYFLQRKNWISYTLVAFLLAQTRAGYWTLFLGLGLFFLVADLLRRYKLNWRKYLAMPLLVITLGSNWVIYNSPSPALEGGITAYFSYSKYQYLSLPKMDMDVFLSGDNGIFSEDYGPKIPLDASEAEANEIFQKAAIDSALANPKETLLALMQKFENYFVGVQKVPHLPGAYVLNQDSKSIEIGDERLRWSLILGNLLYEFYRTSLLLCGLLGLGGLLFAKRIGEVATFSQLKLRILAAPWILGAIPALLFYTETRFKVVSETLLFLFVLEVWSVLLKVRKSETLK
jgi:hypothetical protein